MARKQSKQHRSPAHAIFARVPVALGEALDAYLSSLRPRPSQTAVITVALEEYLEKVGFWPREGKGAKG